MSSISSKDFNDAYFLSSLHPKLKEILNFVIYEWSKEESGDLEITSVYREDGGVHGTAPIRGIDLVPVDRNIEKMELIRKFVNDTFDYGKEGIFVCPPVRHGTAPHCHLQSRDETRRMGNEHT